MRPPDVKRPEGAAARSGREGGQLGRRADRKSSANRTFAVVAIKANGTRIICGKFDSHQVAERHAAVLRRGTRLFGGAVVVERVEEQTR